MTLSTSSVLYVYPVLLFFPLSRRGSASASAAASDLPNARHEYLSYILSLMRGHENEHGDSLPKIEITSLRHVAYVLDAFIYYLRSSQYTDISKQEISVITEPRTSSSSKTSATTATKTPESPSTTEEPMEYNNRYES